MLYSIEKNSNTTSRIPEIPDSDSRLDCNNFLFHSETYTPTHYSINMIVVEMAKG